MPDDIVGIWSPSDSLYLEFGSDYTVHNLKIEHQDGMSIGIWSDEVYLYEPGYNLVIYLTSEHEAKVYEIVARNSSAFTWCWVMDLEIENRDDLGNIIGEVIKEAQEGFHLDPELYESFSKVSEDEFFSLLESLNILYPW